MTSVNTRFRYGDMAFNMGIYGLLKFKKVIAAMEIGDYQGTAKEVLHSKYASDVGKCFQKIAPNAGAMQERPYLIPKE